jgi:hypothetical protein
LTSLNTKLYSKSRLHSPSLRACLRLLHSTKPALLHQFHHGAATKNLEFLEYPFRCSIKSVELPLNSTFLQEFVELSLFG